MRYIKYISTRGAPVTVNNPTRFEVKLSWPINESSNCSNILSHTANPGTRMSSANTITGSTNIVHTTAILSVNLFHSYAE